jgi:hypothetical protein
VAAAIFVEGSSEKTLRPAILAGGAPRRQINDNITSGVAKYPDEQNGVAVAVCEEKVL